MQQNQRQATMNQIHVFEKFLIDMRHLRSDVTYVLYEINHFSIYVYQSRILRQETQLHDAISKILNFAHFPKQQ